MRLSSTQYTCAYDSRNKSWTFAQMSFRTIFAKNLRVVWRDAERSQRFCSKAHSGFVVRHAAVFAECRRKLPLTTYCSQNDKQKP